MRSVFKRTAMLAMAGVMAFTAVGCSSKSSSSEHEHGAVVGGNLGSDVNVPMEEMPYGAVLTKFTTTENNVPIDIEFDKRFLSEDVAVLVSNYFEAINKKDAEALKKVVYEPMMPEYLAMKGARSMEDYVSGVYHAIEEYVKGDFEVTYIVISDLTDGDAAAFNTMIKDASPDAKIEKCQILSFDIYYDTAENKSFLLNNRFESGDISYFLYTIDGKPYIMG